MPQIPLSPWRPDQAFRQGQGLIDVRNVVPAQGHWRPQRGLAPINAAQIDNPVQGLFVGTRASGDAEAFIAFNGSILLIPGRTTPLIDISHPGFYSTSDQIRFKTAQFGNLILATNFVNPVQSYSLVTGGRFADLAGSPPKAKYIAVVRDFPVLAYTSDNVDGEDPYQVRWPGFSNGLPDPTNWTRSASSQADSERMSDIGTIQGITGGEVGTVIGETGVRAMFYGKTLFNFDTVERRLGTRLPESIVQYRTQTFFWAPDGICSTSNAQSVQQIGVEKVDRFIRDDHDETFGARMWATVDLEIGHVLWAYCGQGHLGFPNRILRYSVPLDEFSLSDVTTVAIGPGRTFGMTLDDDFFADLDASPADLDDNSLWASLPRTTAVAGFLLQSFSGPTLTARFTTAEAQFAGELNRAIARRAMVLQEGGVAAVEVFAREAPDRDGKWFGPFSRQSDGYHRFRVPGRSHAFRVSLSGDWRTASTLTTIAGPSGER